MNLTFKGGRVDCPKSPYYDGDSIFPNPNMNRAEMMKWFESDVSGFGMNEEQVRTLLCIV